MARVNGRVFPVRHVLVIDGREVQEPFVDRFEEMVGVDGAHDAELRTRPLGTWR